MHRGGGNSLNSSHNHGFNLIEAFNNLALWGENKFVSKLKRTYKFQRGINNILDCHANQTRILSKESSFVAGDYVRSTARNDVKCHTEDNSPKYRMVGNDVGLESQTDKSFKFWYRDFCSSLRANAKQSSLLNRLRNKCAMTCFANMNQNIFNDKDFSLKKAAFTLAEVLITLGIIGVVAAMTMPTLIANYQKQVATTRLKKFYTTYSQAYNQSKNYNYDIDGADILKNGLNSTQMMDWYDTYLRPYFKTVRADKTKYGVEVAFPDGSGMLIEKDGCAAGTVCTHVVYCVQYKYCEEIKDKGHIYLLPDAKHTFLFYTSGVPSEVYEYKEDGSMVGLTNYDRETALTSCKKGKRNCTRLLYMDNWEIKKDYPWWN